MDRGKLRFNRFFPELVIDMQCFGNNVARDGKASQVDTYNDHNNNLEASRAINGDTSGR